MSLLPTGEACAELAEVLLLRTRLLLSLKSGGRVTLAARTLSGRQVEQAAL